MVHSHISWPRSGDCEGSRIRTRDSCVLCLVSPSCLSQLSHHIPCLTVLGLNLLDSSTALYTVVSFPHLKYSIYAVLYSAALSLCNLFVPPHLLFYLLFFDPSFVTFSILNFVSFRSVFKDSVTMQVRCCKQ
jgi:hypothetical protein